MTKTSYTINSLNYQRNGVSGEGFFYVAFDFKEEGRKHSLIAILPQKYNESTDTHENSAWPTLYPEDADIFPVKLEG